MFKVDGDVKRLLKGGSEVDDILTAVIIKNLKIVQVCYLHASFVTYYGFVARAVSVSKYADIS
jgi:hypothetical protein